jgi:hypothetical protein
MIKTPTSRSIPRRRLGTVAYRLILVSVLLLWSVPAPAQAPPSRPSDKAVADLIEQVDKARDKFEDSLDDSLKQSLLRSTTGEVSVSAYLQDLKDNIKKLKERYGPVYAASAEAEAVLKQCNAIDAYVQRTTTLTKGRSEWEQMASALKNLAAAYGTTFPLPTGAPVRRMGDGETAEAVGVLAESAQQLKSAIGADKALLKPDQDAGKKLADDLSKSAKTLKSRIADGKPTSAESRAVFDQIAKLNTFAIGHPTLLSVPSLTNLRTSLAKLEQSFGITPIR